MPSATDLPCSAAAIQTLEPGLLLFGTAVLAGVLLWMGLRLYARRRSEDAWRSAHAQARREVEETTLALAQANADLRAEIVQRKEVEDALARERSFLREVLDLIPHYVFAKDRAGRFTLANRAIAEAYATTVENLVGKSDADFNPNAEEVAAFLKLDREVLDSREERVTEEKITLEGGDQRFLRTVKRPLAGLAGRVDQVLGVATDVTERRLAELALRETQAFLERAQAVAHIGSWVWEIGGGDALHWSAETLRIFGFRKETFDETLQTFFSRVHPDDLAPVHRALASALEGGEAYAIEHRVVLPDGAVRWVYERADIERDGAGRAVRMIGTVQDVTDFRELQDQLLQSRKIEAIGRLAGGVAHDFNNLLTVILGYADLMRVQIPAGDRLHDALGNIQKAGERAAKLTGQLLAFSRRQILAPRVLDINGVVEGAVPTLKRLLGDAIEIAVSLAPGAGRIRADPGQVQQVIANLAANARDAMPHGGRLTLTTSEVKLDRDHAGARTPVVPGPYVLLSIADTGIGMDEPTRSQAFEPFFTTKDVEGGAGLGLSTAYGIVKQSGGYIWIHSEPGKGTVCSVYFPRFDGEAEAPAPSPGLRPERGSETVLLVEDEAPVRKLVRLLLEDLGYSVLEGDGGAAALDLAAKHPTAIALLLTDLVMPEMSGGELAALLERDRPGTRILFMSGYTDDVVSRDRLLDSGVAFLQKPFTSAALARKVREVLDAA